MIDDMHRAIIALRVAIHRGKEATDELESQDIDACNAGDDWEDILEDLHYLEKTYHA